MFKFSNTSVQPLTLIKAVSPHNNVSNLKFCNPELQFLNWLFDAAPCFPITASKVKIIHDPTDFYGTLVERCKTAQNRITMASLYVGTGQLEKALINTMRDTLKANSKLKINVLLDYQRGTRGIVNSKTMLQDLVDMDPSRCSLNLYHTPYLRGMYKNILPQRWNELIGLQHMKVYIMDDVVIMSGANCSHDYFTNRQDRYVEIEDADLADFYCGLINTVAEVSLPCPPSTREPLPVAALSPYRGDFNAYVKHAQSKINLYFSYWCEKQQAKLAKMSASDVEHPMPAESEDTWVFPLIQMAQLGVMHDSAVTCELLRCVPRDSQLRIATGYFNLPQEYAQTMLHECAAQCSVLMAHPNASGFKGAAGAAGGIPSAYSLLAARFAHQVELADQQARVKLLEYERPGWTFHAKGLWYYPPDSETPCLSLIGSPNLGQRSVSRDLETQLALVTVNDALRAALHDECDKLHQPAVKAEPNRPAPLWVRVVVPLFNSRGREPGHLGDVSHKSGALTGCRIGTHV